MTAKYQGQEVKTVKLETVFKNEPTTTEFTKSDITTGVELDGATLTVLDSDGKEVEKWTSVKGKAHVIKKTPCGKNLHTSGRVCTIWLSAGRGSEIYSF